MSLRASYRFGGYELRPATRELLTADGPVTLTSRAFDCLHYLIEHRDRAVGRDELASAVWGQVDVSDAQLSQSILRARKAVGDAGNDQLCIRTVHKFGYHWVAETTEAQEPVPSVAVPQETTVAGPAEPRVVAVREEARHAQSESSAQVVGRTPTAMRRWTWAIGAAVVLLLGGSWLAQKQDTPEAPLAVVDSEPRVSMRVIVLPINVAVGIGADWVRLGAIDVIANRMRSAGLPVPPSETMIALLRAEGDVADPEGLRGSAEWIVSGSAERSARGWRVVLQALDPHGNRLVSEAETHDVLDAFRETTDAVLRQLGFAAPSTPALPHSIEEPLQRAQAALLENDFESARQILAESPALLADEPELRFQMVLVDFRAGRLDQVVPALRQLLDSQGITTRAWLKARAHTLLGSVDLMMDRAADAETEFESALALIGPDEYPLDHARALGGRGAARATQERYAEGLADLGQARLELQRGGDALAQARMDLMIGSLELLRRRPAAARTVLTDAIDRLQQFGAWNERMHGYSELMLCEFALLDYQSADAASEAAFALFPNVENGFHRAEAYLHRIQLRILQGRLAEAEALFADVDALQLPAHPRFDGIAHALRAALSDWRGQSETVITEAGRAIELLPVNEKPLAALAVRMRQRALLSEGRLDEAAQSLNDLRGFLSGADAPVAVLIARAELEHARGHGDAAEQAFAAALDSAERDGIPAERLWATGSWVEALIADQRLDQAGSLVGRLIPIAQQDFRFALLELRFAHARQRLPEWTRALQRATRLAGERTIPSQLRQPREHAAHLDLGVLDPELEDRTALVE
ncbi:MAG: winged helix-turn-helix domain-containing protein [Pseudomarimonas sp.]